MIRLCHPVLTVRCDVFCSRYTAWSSFVSNYSTFFYSQVSRNNTNCNMVVLQIEVTVLHLKGMGIYILRFALNYGMSHAFGKRDS
jgi:hypothetical protein